jgi:hypothetical protein
MSPRRFLIGTLVAASFAAAAVGAIHIMKLRLRSDDVGARIQRLERSITESKKELDALKRARDQTQDSLQLKQIAGEDLKPPVPEQVTFVRLSPTVTAVVPLKNTASPRVTALNIAFRPTTGQGGNGSR